MVDDAFVGSVSLPMESLLDGIPCRIQSYRFFSPLQGLRISRYPGDMLLPYTPEWVSHPHGDRVSQELPPFPSIPYLRTDNLG